MNSEANRFVRWDDFICTFTGDIATVEFLAGGWIHDPCDLLSNLAGVEITIAEWVQDGQCGWRPGPVLCRNVVAVEDMVIEPLCVDMFGIQQHHFTVDLPNPCPQTEGQHYSILIGGVVADPEGCFMCWGGTAEPQLCEGQSIDRKFGQRCLSPEDMAFTLFTPPSCPCEDINGDAIVGYSDIRLILAAWGPCEEETPDTPLDGCGPCPEDIDQDQDVGYSDVLRVLAAWGPCGEE